MAKQLVHQPLENLGINGLSTQYNPATLPPAWLTSADNVMIRESGRLSSRKGLKQKVVPSGVAIGSMIEHNDQGTNKVFASHGTSIYTVDFTTPQTAFPSSGADVKRTVANSTGDWQFINFNKRLHCFHAGIVPQRYDGSLGNNLKWSNHFNEDTAVNLPDASQITAPNIVAAKTYKITALGNSNFYLIGANAEPAVGDIFTSTMAGSAAFSTTGTAPEMVPGDSYKIITLGDTNFNLNGADSSPAVGEIFTANSILGIGTGQVVEVLTGTTGTLIEIKTNSTLTTITVDSTTGFPTTGHIIIDNEIIQYTGITSTTFTGCIRGALGTVAVYHNDNSPVETATIPYGITTFDPSCAMGFYGRMWVGGITEAKDVLYYSALLDGDDFRSVGTGLIDLKTVWGNDEIMHIAPFYGQLVVFGKRNIAVYDNPSDPSNMSLNEVISGIGCIHRDSVQEIGDDLVFVSATGLRSLSRTTEKDKLPLTDLSINIKDTLIRNIDISPSLKSVYIVNEGIYILSFIDSGVTYVFDFKQQTTNGTPRVTTWSFLNDRNPASMIDTKLYSGLLVGQKDGGIAIYEGFFDADLSYVSSALVTTNAPITSDISTTQITMGDGMTAAILKKLEFVLQGGSGATLGLKWFRDYSHTELSSTQIPLNPTTSGVVALWGASSSLYGTTTVTTTNAGSFVTNTYYAISVVGSTDFTAIGASANTVGIVFKATGAGSGNGAAVSHVHVAGTHSQSTKYTPVFGLQEYRTSLTGSAKHLKLNLSIVSNGFDTSIQEMSILSLQGKTR